VRDRHAAIIGGAALAAVVVGGFFDLRAALAAYLVAVVGWSALPIGALEVLMIATLVHGRWSEQIRPPLTAAVTTLPAMGLLFVPVLIGAAQLYPWGHEPIHAAHPGFKSVYLSPVFFALRTIAYFAVWSVTARRLIRASADGNPRPAAAIGLILYAVTGSLAAVDWAMSVEPEFHSSIYGLFFLARQAVAGLALGILLRRRGDPVAASLGGALIAAILLWVYLQAMQFIVIWAGDLPDEVVWYLERVAGAWQIAPYLLAIGNGFLPFFLLLSERARASPRMLAGVSALLIAMGFVEAGWLILPPLHLAALAGWLLVPLAVVGVGGVWSALFLRASAAMPVRMFSPPASSLE
jgi:hypothetical protein